MPKIKIDKVISFSSQDPVYIANNILLNDPSKKWKCQSAGEKSANLVLQLEEAAVISSIDIGNEHSAYIEVLVSRSCANDDFKVLLVMSSFMSPLEARQSTNINKVRMFTRDQLITPERDEKWDRIKIVCTQPFNRHVQYGLSFITFHTCGTDDKKPQTPHIGKFALRPESPNNITAGSLFARKKELEETKPLTAAAAIRNASLSLEQSPRSKKFKLIQNTTATNQDMNIPNVSRKRDEIFYSKDEEEPNEKIESIVEQKNLEKQKLEEKVIRPIKPKEHDEKTVQKQNNKKSIENPEASTSRESGGRLKRKSDKLENASNKKVKKRPQKPFHQLLSDVVIVISGIQNPDRTNTRNMATAMGAKYKADWDNSCTHLICAFPNTPKFNQVKGKGKIVTKTWISDCHAKRRRLPWRRYALDKSDKKKDESEEEIFEETNIAHGTSVEDDDNRDIKSGSDTEDEIERINIQQLLKDKDDPQENGEKQPVNNNNSTSVGMASDAINILDADTDEEDSVHKGSADYPSLPNIFQGNIFYIGDSLSNDERKTLVKYIIACNGTVASSLITDVDYLITTEEYKLPSGNILSGTKVIHPNFVYECFNSKESIPHDKFVL